MSADLLVLRARDVAPQPWRNGGGRTRELLTWPAAATGHATRWQLRVSLADICRAGPFSPFPGVERWFTVVEGAGVRLTVAAREHRLDAASAPLRFDGASPVDCALIDGPTRDLNLMTAAGTGALVAAAPGTPWHSAAPMRGLFTRVAGRCSDGAQSLALPAQTLLWRPIPSAEPWRFVPDGAAAPPGGPPPGWWLEYWP